MKNVNTFFRQLYLVSAVLFLTALGVALMIWRDPAVLIGLAVGYALGVVPFASWHLIVKLTDGFTRKDRIRIAVAIGLGKYAGLGAALYYLLTKELVNLFAFVAGTAVVIPVLVVLSTTWSRNFAK